MREFKYILRERRIKANMSITQLSKNVGVARDCIWKYEHGVLPNIYTVIDIARALNLSLDEFLEYSI